MEVAFWNGVTLDNFMFNNVHIKSYPEFIGVCFIAAAIALVFECSRTVRDWLYLEFLRKRSCHLTSSEAPMALRTVKPLSQTSGQICNESSTDWKVESNGKNGTDSVNTSERATTTMPVIATGNLHSHGSGKHCHKPHFGVGLLELSLSTLLHMCQVILGYILMLLVMTFNVWIFLAVLIGTSIGFFVFDTFNKKIHALKINTTPLVK